MRRFLVPRWDETGDRADVVQLRGRRSGRVQGLQDAAVAGKFGPPLHRKAEPHAYSAAPGSTPAFSSRRVIRPSKTRSTSCMASC